MTPLERVQAALEAAGSRRQGALSWTCPAHDDQRASLSVKEGRDRRAIFHCHAGCHPEDVLAAIKLTWDDLFAEGRRGRKAEPVTEYSYTDERDQLLYQVVRFYPKEFRCRRPDDHGGWTWNLNGVREVLYRLPQVMGAIEAGDTVYVVEGERDVHAIERAGGTATTNRTGAEGPFLPEFAELLAKTRVIVVVDNDAAGRKWARRVTASIREYGGQVEVVRPVPDHPKADAADHLAAGHGLDGFLPLDLETEAGHTGDTEDSAESADPPQERRRLKLTPASQIKPKPVRWAWKDRAPAGMVTLIPGREGIGKSLLLVWLTARLTRGELPGLHYGTPKMVFYAATEDSWDRTIVPRLMAADADLDLVYRVEVKEEVAEGKDLVVPLTLPVDCAALTEGVRDHGVAMLALDPLMSTIDPGIDTHRDRELRLALEPLAAMADTTGCAVVGLAHFNKSSSTDVLNLVTGSRAFTAVLRSVIAVARDPDDEAGTCVVSQEKNNLGRLDLPNLGYVIKSASIPTDEGPADVGQLEFVGEVDRSVRDILGERGDAGERAERDEAADWLRDYLTHAGGSAERADIIKAAKTDGISERTLDRARHNAGVTAKRAGFGQPAFWRLSPFPPQSRHSRQEPDGGGNGGTGGGNGGDTPTDEGSGNGSDTTRDHEEWSFGEPSVPCVACRADTSNRDPDGRPLHLACAKPDDPGDGRLPGVDPNDPRRFTR